MIKKILVKSLEKILPAGFYIQHLPDLAGQNYPDFKKDLEIYNSGTDRLTRDGARVLMIKYLLDMVFHLPEGEYAELGTFQGNFARLLFKHKYPDAQLYCFDTFEGFHERDINIEKEVTRLKIKKGRFSDTSLEKVRHNILGDKDRDSRLHLIKGYFPESLNGQKSIRWRFVHLDADLYEPIKEGVRIFWPNIVPGGILLVHDYNGGYVGTKKAIDEYFSPLGIKPVPLPDKSGSAMVIKGER